MAQTLQIVLEDFDLKATWNTTNGHISGIYPSNQETPVTVSGIPEGQTVQSATLHFIAGKGTTNAAELTVEGVSFNENASNSVPLPSTTITGNGSFVLHWYYRPTGASLDYDGSHTSIQSIKEMYLAVEFTGDVAPDEEPDYYVYPESHNICVYAPDAKDYSTNGLGVLSPTVCTIREEAGGEYELEMELPAIGEEWKYIETDSIIKSPVPTVIMDGFTMGSSYYYKVLSTVSSVPVKSKVPSLVRVADSSTASEWSASRRYQKGDRCSYGGKVYQYTGPVYARPDGTVVGALTSAPPGSYWADVTSYSTTMNYGSTLATLSRNEIFTVLNVFNSGWLKVKTNAGVNGYVESKYAEMVSQIEIPVEGRVISEQCFRVYRVEKDSDTMTIKVNARHLSYDFARTMLSTCEAKQVTAPTAIGIIQGVALSDDNRQVLTNIDEKCDLDCSWDNCVTALLDPETGIVAQLEAKVIRDNEDYYILRDDHTDRGFRVEYGNNLMAVNWSIDTSDMVTRIYPHCKDKDDAALTLPEMYVDSPRIFDYPIVYTETLSVSAKENAKGVVDGEEVPSLSKDQCYQLMREEANRRFTEDHADEPEITVDIDLVMLGSTVEYQHLAELETLCMYDTVHIRHPRLNIDVEAYMTGYEYDAILRRYSKITLTNARRRGNTSISGYNVKNNSIRFEKLSTTAVDRLRA